MAIAREAEPVGSLSEVKEAGLDREDLLGIYRNMLITRGIEERGHILYKQGKIPGSFYTGRGNEAASVGVATAMGPEDVGTPLHRDMGVHVTRGVEPWRIFAQYMGRADGPTKGRDGNVHMADSHLGLIAMVSHLPAMLPVAVGCALAFRIREEKRVAVGWFGEGASARGDAHEAMNLAGVRQLPVVFICDNNQWAYSTPTHLEFATEHLADRAQAYGFEGVVVDGTDVLAVYREAKRAIEKAREGGGPTLIECLTLRMEGHAVHDDAFYVPKEMFEEWAKNDPIERFRTWLRENAEMTDEEEDEISAGVKKLLNDALTRAEESPLPDPARCSRASTRRPKTSTRPTTNSHGREDLSPGDLRRPPPGDAARQARVRDRRGRRRLRRRLQGHAGLPGGVRPLARDRRAALGDGDRRRLHRRGDHGHAARRRDAVRGLHLVRVGSPRHGRRQAALPRRHAGADRRPAPVGRRLLRRAVPLAEPGELVRAHPGPQVRLPGDARGREGPARQRDRGSEPGALLRAQAPLPADQGRGARRALHDADRQGAHPPRGRATSPSSPGARWSTPPRRPRSSSRRTASRSRSSTCARSCRGTRRRCSSRCARRRRCSSCTRTRAPAASAPRSRRRSPRRRSRTSTRRCKRITAPDTPVPFSPPLEKAFIPQVEDVAAGLRELAEY